MPELHDDVACLRFLIYENIANMDHGKKERGEKKGDFVSMGASLTVFLSRGLFFLALYTLPYRRDVRLR